jgi:hypothetical protein
VGDATKSFVAIQSANGLYASISAVHAAAQPIVTNQELGKVKPTSLSIELLPIRPCLKRYRSRQPAPDQVAISTALTWSCSHVISTLD